MEFNKKNSLLMQVHELVRQHGPPRLIYEIEKHIKESLLIQTEQPDDNDIPIGISKIGGFPDIPTYIEWPEWRGKPLAFIAQINLTELPKYDFLNVLPQNGILSFFYSAEQETWGFDPKDKGSWRVYYFEEVELSRRSYPIDWLVDGKYVTCSVEFVYSITVPNLESPYIHIGFGPSNLEEVSKYSEMWKQISEFLNEGNCINRLMGHPDQIQGDMQRECQLASHGIYMGDLHYKNNPEVKKLEAGALDWELLLQIDSDDHANMMWGDVGRLYFWIPSKALSEKNFDSTWMVLQCT